MVLDSFAGSGTNSVVVTPVSNVGSSLLTLTADQTAWGTGGPFNILITATGDSLTQTTTIAMTVVSSSLASILDNPGGVMPNTWLFSVDTSGDPISQGGIQWECDAVDLTPATPVTFNFVGLPAGVTGSVAGGQPQTFSNHGQVAVAFTGAVDTQLGTTTAIVQVFAGSYEVDMSVPLTVYASGQIPAVTHARR